MEQSATKNALRPCVTQPEGTHYVQIDLVAISSQEGRFQKFGDFTVAGSRREPSLAHSNGVGAFGRTHQDGVDGFLTLWLLAYTPYQWSSFAGMINAEVLCG